MPLPTPKLDDRLFQDIVDQAKGMIWQYCPEWTDHNVSDPGVTLIELFAWMTDTLLYRVNQVPDKMYITFLELLGIRLAPPQAARVPVTFYLSAAQPNLVPIPAGTEVATVRTDTDPAIIFTTESLLQILPARIAGACTYSTQASGDSWWIHDLKQLNLPNMYLSIFPPQPAPDDAFYIRLEQNFSNHVLGLLITCSRPAGAGVDPRNPPLVWQAWGGSIPSWSSCEVESDETGGFNRSGEILLHIPPLAPTEVNQVRGYWLRCVLTSQQAGNGGYDVSPEITQLTAESRGGTVHARHAVTEQNEVLGKSNGSPGQVFQLRHAPVLERDPERDYLIVEPPGSEPEVWTEMPHFGASTENDRHYTLETDGTITLAPATLQPNGDVYRFGVIPRKDSVLRFSRYQYGGGASGNVQAFTLVVPKKSLAYIARVCNRVPAKNGRDAQRLEQAKVQAPLQLRTRDRAVTADDYVFLAEQIPEVARAYCFAPDTYPADREAPQPGRVVVAVLPYIDHALPQLEIEQLIPTVALIDRVHSALVKHSVLGSRVEVQGPQLFQVSVRARISAIQSGNRSYEADLCRRAETALYRYLNPLIGGVDEHGWSFGRHVYLSDIYQLLQQISGIAAVREVQMYLPESTTPLSEIAVSPTGLICSSQHVVTCGN